MSDKRSFSIHGHFYQPPREDLFTGKIPEEPGAAPYPNWNERVLDTCYRPNAELRNFSKLSFNLGPTLAEWLAKAAPEVLARIVGEDKVNQAIYGAGNAIAQAYNHRILPLASMEDKLTQIKWGSAAFQSVFERLPEGMWLPETAVDVETLCLLADEGIQFTILAPWQVEILEGHSPYTIELPGERSIVAFVYYGGLSSTMSFDAFATGNADAFAEFYLKPEIDRYDAEQLILVATDGELYGHHQPFRDQFIAHLMNGAVKGIGLQQSWPALWLKQHEVKGKARIVENTSWSCHHGVERWRRDCGCTANGAWKAPLKAGFDALNEGIFTDFVDLVQSEGIDGIQARNDYIRVALELTGFDDWLGGMTKKSLSMAQRLRIERALEAQFTCQKMFTSCGWFFDDLLRIEPQNNIRFAARGAALMREVTGRDYSEIVMPYLAQAANENHNRTAADDFIVAYMRLIAK
jgi:hypothetical protein